MYFGLGDFNARRRATNFTLAKLPDVVSSIHHHNAKAYVALNTLVFSEELPAAAEYARAIADAGADAIIVQDIGLACLIQRLAPTLEVHASTQMTQTEELGVEFLRSLGFGRVILARELTLAEVNGIGRKTAVPLEVFVHGAICISYSGQCLASESLWGRSANRGLCAQACRLPYRLVIDGQIRDLGDRKYLVSAQDLFALGRLRDLVSMGVVGFKIEGRLKSAGYVAAAARLYREALDAAVQGMPFAPSPQQRDELAMGFSRGLGSGFLEGVDHQHLVHGRFPKNRGLFIGTVVGRTRRAIVVELAGEKSNLPFEPPSKGPTSPGPGRGKTAGGIPASPEPPLKPGDGVVFDEGCPERDERGGRVFSVRSISGDSSPRGQVSNRALEITFGRGNVNTAAVPIGARVWKTDDPALRKRLDRNPRRNLLAKPESLKVRAEAQPGGSLRICLSANDMNKVTVSWEGPLRPAEKHPLTTELIREQFGRLGGTPFQLTGVELYDGASRTESVPVMAPKSVLNDLRRRGVQALLERREAAHRHAVDSNALASLRGEVKRYFNAETHAAAETLNAEPPTIHLCVLVRTAEQLQAVLDWASSAEGAENTAICFDFSDSNALTQAMRRCRAAGRRGGLATPRVLMPGEISRLEAIALLSPDWVLIRNLGALAWFRRVHPELALVGDQSLNTANEIAAYACGREGIRRLTPGCDLNWSQLKAMLAYVPPRFLEVVLHQHVPMFHMRHCLYAANLSRAADCDGCERPCLQHDLRLRDRNGEDHPVLVDLSGRNTVFNAAAQSAMGFVPEMLEAGLRHFRVELLEEQAVQVGALLTAYASVLIGKMEPTAGMRRLRACLSSPVRSGTHAFE